MNIDVNLEVIVRHLQPTAALLHIYCLIYRADSVSAANRSAIDMYFGGTHLEFFLASQLS